MSDGYAYNPMMKELDPALSEARERIRQAGLKATAARMRVLAALAGTRGLMSHHDIEQALESGRQSIDRVTLYRVLESLVAGGLAHRVAGMDRTWRFGAVLPAGSPGMVRQAHDRHAHFQCNDCGKIVCLREVAARRRALRVPRGYRTEAVELTVKGRCAQCAPGHRP